VVLRDVTLELPRGEALAVTGPSGSGKSTLLHLLGTLDRPTAGTVRLDGCDPFAPARTATRRLPQPPRRLRLSDHHLLPQCTVLENVLIPTLIHPNESKDAEAWAKELLKRVGLAERLDHRPAELSGGERQRVAVARALVRRPVLLLADEPTGNLDRATAKAVGELLLELHRQEQTILVVVTHSAELATLFPRRMEMADGTLHTA